MDTLVFFISTTDKLNTKLFGNDALSQGSDGDFSFGAKLSIEFLPGNCSRYISLLSDFAVICLNLISCLVLRMWLNSSVFSFFIPSGCGLCI